jgi:hypothetical protein
MFCAGEEARGDRRVALQHLTEDRSADLQVRDIPEIYAAGVVVSAARPLPSG